MTGQAGSKRGPGDGASADDLLVKAAYLAAHPAFPRAVRQYTQGQARLREAPRLVNRLVSSDSRWRIVGYLLYLDADRDRFGERGGATYGRLLELCLRRNQASPRVLKTTLALLKVTGFICNTTSVDKRLRLYQPTERMMAFARLWLEYGTGALDVLEPEHERSRGLRENPAFISSFLVSGGREHVEDPVSARLPEMIEAFGTREGSGAVLFALLKARFDDAPAPTRAELARLYGLSKSQVRNNIMVSVDHGLLALDGAGNPSPTQRLLDLYNRWISIELAFYSRHMPASQRPLRHAFEAD